VRAPGFGIGSKKNQAGFSWKVAPAWSRISRKADAALVRNRLDDYNEPRRGVGRWQARVGRTVRLHE